MFAPFRPSASPAERLEPNLDVATLIIHRSVDRVVSVVGGGRSRISCVCSVPTRPDRETPSRSSTGRRGRTAAASVPGSGVSDRFTGGGTVDEEVEEFADLDVSFEGMAQVGVGLEVVAVATPLLVVRQVPAGFEFGDDALSRPFRDPDAVGDVPQSDPR